MSRTLPARVPRVGRATSGAMVGFSAISAGFSPRTAQAYHNGQSRRGHLWWRHDDDSGRPRLAERDGRDAPGCRRRSRHRRRAGGRRRRHLESRHRAGRRGARPGVWRVRDGLAGAAAVGGARLRGRTTRSCRRRARNRDREADHRQQMVAARAMALGYHVASMFVGGLGGAAVLACWTAPLLVVAWFLDHRSYVVLVVGEIVALALVVVAPRVARLVAQWDTRVAGALLGPSRHDELAQQVASLARSRA